MSNRPLFLKKRTLALWALTLLSLSILLMSLSTRFSFVRETRETLSEFVAPVRYLESLPLEVLTTLHHFFLTKQMLSIENQQLKKEIRQQHFELQQLENTKLENQRFRTLLNAAKSLQGSVHVESLLAFLINNGQQKLVLSNHNKKRTFMGQAVFDELGLVGQVIETNRFSSTVLLITDRRSAIPIVDARSRIRSVINGEGNLSILSLAGVEQTADIEVGDELLTTGLGGRFPAGYPVGRVTKVTHDPSEQFATIKVSPLARIAQDYFYMLYRPFKKALPVVQLKDIMLERANENSK
jgi:rod shape-determining protein MreC